MDEGLLIVRIVFGLLMAAHGAQKLFGWLEGPGLRGTAALIESLGFRPAWFFATSNALAEAGGGLLLAAGLLGPVGPAAVIAVMLVAITTVHWTCGLLATTNGIELPLLYLAVATAIVCSGHGRYSLDVVLGLDGLWRRELVAIVLACAVLGALASLGLRRLPRAAHAA